jgi:hypothetical protein
MSGRGMRIALSCVRVALGFALASLAASLTLVLFAYAPDDLESLRADLGAERLSEAGLMALYVTRWVAVCAAVPVLAGALFAEVRKVGRWWFYALAGIATAAAGFVLVHEASLPSLYELAAFLTSGVAGGLAYWALAGRFARPRPGASPGPNPGPAAPAGAPPPAAAPGP